MKITTVCLKHEIIAVAMSNKTAWWAIYEEFGVYIRVFDLNYLC